MLQISKISDCLVGSVRCNEDVSMRLRCNTIVINCNRIAPCFVRSQNPSRASIGVLLIAGPRSQPNWWSKDWVGLDSSNKSAPLGDCWTVLRKSKSGNAWLVRRSDQPDCPSTLPSRPDCLSASLWAECAATRSPQQPLEEPTSHQTKHWPLTRNSRMPRRSDHKILLSHTYNSLRSSHFL